MKNESVDSTPIEKLKNMMNPNSFSKLENTGFPKGFPTNLQSLNHPGQMNEAAIYQAYLKQQQQQQQNSEKAKANKLNMPGSASANQSAIQMSDLPFQQNQSQNQIQPTNDKNLELMMKRHQEQMKQQQLMMNMLYQNSGKSVPNTGDMFNKTPSSMMGNKGYPFLQQQQQQLPSQLGSQFGSQFQQQQQQQQYLQQLAQSQYQAQDFAKDQQLIPNE